MPGLDELKVSLTKNGYFKVAEVIAKHPRHEVLTNIRGRYTGINLDYAQIANMLSADPKTGELPEEWDEIRQYPKLGCLNWLLPSDRFLDSRCQSRFSSAWWRRIFKVSASSRTGQLRPIEFFISS